MLMEKERGTGRIMIPLLVLGLLVSAYYGVRLLTSEVYPVISSHHIKYSGEFPQKWALLVFAGYATATLVPLFISSRRNVWLLGLLMAVSCLITGILYKEYLTSVWCFFAALISIMIYCLISADSTRVRGKDGKIS
jgi:urea transporter